MATFQTMLSRLKAGEPYYPVFGEELRRGHYPARSAFNWRTPLLLSTLARVPDIVGRIVLIVLGLLLLGATLSMVADEPLRAVAGSLMQAGAVVTIVAPGAFLFGESWAGVLIGLSVCLHQRKQARLAIPLGLLALFVRELAAPYCVACTIAAAFTRRWREVGAWLCGACLYAAYYVWHLAHVWAHRLPNDAAHASSWLELGGLPSLLVKAQWQAWLMVSPPWTTALAMTIVAAGIIAVKTPLHVRLASAVYVGFFAVAGKPFGGYWGLIAWPTWAIACGYGVELLRDAARAMILRPHPL